MKKYFWLLIIVFKTTIAYAAGDTFNMSASLEPPISIGEDTAVSFGTIIHNQALTSIITLNTNDTATSNQPSDIITGAKSGTYTINGAGALLSNILINGINNFAHGSTALDTILVPTITGVTLGGPGLITVTIKVSGIITIPGGAPAGHYIGSFNLVSNY